MRTSKLLAWIDRYLLLLLSSFLVAFIPLYPKIPLFDALPGYIVRVRLEDILVFLTLIVYLIQVLRKKIKWKNQINKWIFAYIVVALLSIISGIFIIPTIPMEMLHIGKSMLHWFRYIEYFSLFFILYSSIQEKKDIKVIFYTLTFTVFAITFYGYGQKNWYWPVYSTMNREFSKGIRLYLTEHARVQSTFGGHYDLSAYLVILLPIFYTLMLNVKEKKERNFLRFIHLIGLWLLIVAASRTSLVAYLIAILFSLIFSSMKMKTFWKKLGFFLKRGLLFTVMFNIMIYTFGDDIRERFEQVLQGYPETYQTYVDTQKLVADRAHHLVDLANNFKNSLKQKESRPPENSVAFDNTVLTPTDTQPTTSRPVDVYVDVPVEVEEEDENGNIIVVEKERTWSENALKYGLSVAIRLDELWPNAIKGLMRNPLFGSAYATLNKKEFVQFTEAESTDNNFLRTLGETGILGFITFYGTIFLLLRIFYKNQKKTEDETLKMANLAFITASIGLLVNATYIDVFASSKVAFTYWALAGALLAYNQISMPATINKNISKKNTKTKKKKIAKKTK